MDLEFIDPNKDVPRVRVFDLGTNRVFAKQTDPYGFITLNYERNKIPAEFSGNYTTWRDAEAAIELLKQRRAEAKADEPKTERKAK